MNIQEVLHTMNQLVADGIMQRYAVGGAVGATFYLEAVSTLDVDIFVELHAAPGSKLLSLDPILSYLRERGCRMEGEHIVISDWPVQFIPPTDPLTEEALDNAKEIDVAGLFVRVFTPEYLAAIAVQTGRAKDKARVLQFVEAGVLDSTKFEQLVARHGLTDKWRKFKQQFLS